jgi:hypothetical protein
MFVPLYVEGSLGKVIDILHGMADVVTGPYDWNSQPPLNLSCENPAALVFPDSSTGALTYSLWVCGDVMTASSPNGPFVKAGSYPGGNPAPVFHNGAFYLTNQKTTQIYSAPALGAAWSIFGNISDPNLPTDDYHVEDPFLWVDKRGNWHIINHAYSNMQFTSCGASYVSAHWFSEDGKDWHWSDQPYAHTVFYDDGSNHTYTTLERPNLHFNAAGVITHINLAADMEVGDEGCANRTKHAHNGHTPCVSGARFAEASELGRPRWTQPPRVATTVVLNIPPPPPHTHTHLSPTSRIIANGTITQGARLSRSGTRDCLLL